MRFKKAFGRAIATAAVFSIALLVLYSCEDKSTKNLPITGSWSLSPGTASEENWLISEESIEYTTSYYSYTADIIDYETGSLNGGDTSITDGGDPGENPGYAVICYTSVSDAGTGTVGKYNIFRWQDNAADSSLRDFTQGYKSVDSGSGNYDNDVFDTAEEAVSGATNGAGYFSYASAGASKD